MSALAAGSSLIGNLKMGFPALSVLQIILLSLVLYGADCTGLQGLKPSSGLLTIHNSAIAVPLAGEGNITDAGVLQCLADGTVTVNEDTSEHPLNVSDFEYVGYIDAADNGSYTLSFSLNLTVTLMLSVERPVTTDMDAVEVKQDQGTGTVIQIHRICSINTTTAQSGPLCMTYHPLNDTVTVEPLIMDPGIPQNQLWAFGYIPGIALGLESTPKQAEQALSNDAAVVPVVDADAKADLTTDAAGHQHKGGNMCLSTARRRL
ncbi:hypothetical protein B0H16DRAFT_1712696 [Mycena metata]|uniref:Uncharacterized protein n=1 Tax=Mycena metata TaxID=1033252 RepID=A0AAD7K1E0_9AGAR|nr:hypothetical protein B0H16DRAFT_1712696 [Mycena metata]